jgi:high-affinity nickel-transport protein
VLRTAPGEVVRPVGVKGRLLGRLRHVTHPAAIALVGALFALSFDTLSQAAFFALTATQFGGWQHALLLALAFMAGMLLTDGINGLWIARLIARADQVAAVASRVMGLVVSAISLLVAAFGAAKLASPALDAWSEGKELAFGFALVAAIAAAFLGAVNLTRRRALAA